MKVLIDTAKKLTADDWGCAAMDVILWCVIAGTLALILYASSAAPQIVAALAIFATLVFIRAVYVKRKARKVS